MNLSDHEKNYAICAQVNSELPCPHGGFETDEEERNWSEMREKRFFELVSAVQPVHETPTRRLHVRYLNNLHPMTTDEQNDAIRAQVNAKLPRPIGGFETDDDEQDWMEAQEKCFIELVHEIPTRRLYVRYQGSLVAYDWPEGSMVLWGAGVMVLSRPDRANVELYGNAILSLEA